MSDSRTKWRRRAVRAAKVGALLAVLGALALLGGIVPIEASSGHWGVTHWFLDFTKRRTVEAHTLLAEEPRLDEPWLVLKGAGHFEAGCAPCHGSPALPTPRVPAAMTPAPPPLAPAVARWDADELVHIVDHGIKFTGMPAWPARGRRDEVRAVVAFLQELPRLDAATYRELVHGDLPAGAPGAPLSELAGGDAPAHAAASCARCHGEHGEGRGNAAFPKLAGQSADYLEGALAAYANGARPSGMMAPFAAPLTAAQRRALAQHYATLSIADSASGTSAVSESPDDAARAAIERGRVLATTGVAARGLPACADCHGPGPIARNPAYPELAGQYAAYLELQLELFAAGQRGGSPFAHLMDHVAPRLTADERRDVAAYYASLPPGAGRPR